MFAAFRHTALLCLLIATAPISAEAGGLLSEIGQAAENAWKLLTDPSVPPHPPPKSSPGYSPYRPEISPYPGTQPSLSGKEATAKPPDFPNPHRYGEQPVPKYPDVQGHFLPPAPQTKERVNLSWRIAAAFDAPPRLILAPSRAKLFGKAFSKGARANEKYLGELRQINPLARSWLAAPVDLRVFVVGAAESDPDVKLFRDKLTAQGYQVFFYLFCKEATGNLCASEEVGAFYATAGHVVAFRSTAFEKSPYIDVEVATIYQHSKGGIVLVFTPRQAVLAGVSALAPPVAATCFELAPSRQRRKEAREGQMPKSSKASGQPLPQRREGGCPAAARWG